MTSNSHGLALSRVVSRGLTRAQKVKHGSTWPDMVWHDLTWSEVRMVSHGLAWFRLLSGGLAGGEGRPPIREGVEGSSLDTSWICACIQECIQAHEKKAEAFLSWPATSNGNKNSVSCRAGCRPHTRQKLPL